MQRWTFLACVAIAAGCSGAEDTRTGEIEQDVTQCGSAFVEGIDVYDGQGTIDWGKVAASGRGFAFIKATQGNYGVQSTFRKNWANAGSAGVLRSAYHFFDPTIDGSAQAQYFLAALGSAGGMTNADLPAMLDIECPASSSQTASKSDDPACEYSGDDGWVATATLKQRIDDWVAVVTAATGRAPIVYSYPAWFADVADTEASLADLPLFIASYNSCGTVPSPWTSAVFWQYSATSTVPGITGKLDVDRFFGSAEDLAAWNAGTVPPDAGAPDQPDAGGGGGGGGGEQADAGGGGQMKQAGGCGCETRGAAPGGWLAAGLVALAVLRRRRRCSSCSL